MHVCLYLSVFLIFSSCSHLVKRHINTKELSLLKTYDIKDLELNKFMSKDHYLDIVLINSDQVKITWSDLKEEFIEARRVFKKYGVNLNLILAVKVSFPKDWNGVEIRKHKRKPLKNNYDFYDKSSYTKSFLPKKAENLFKKIIRKVKKSSKGINFHDNTVYVVGISDLLINWFEKDKDDKWKLVSSKTSAISFPSYMYEDRIDKSLRGLISLQKVGSGHKTLAHELGHKLINVSHEGLNSCPQGDGAKIPGLMGYGKSKEIFGGLKGRWHLERLKLSPFLYKRFKKVRKWNKPYVNKGSYDDPIYKGFIIKPACI